MASTSVRPYSEESIDPGGDAPDERTYPTLTALGDDKLVMYGGFPAFPSFAKWGGPMAMMAGGGGTARGRDW